jgi:hypothetical protein
LAFGKNLTDAENLANCKTQRMLKTWCIQKIKKISRRMQKTWWMAKTRRVLKTWRIQNIKWMLKTWRLGKHWRP